MDKDEIKLLDVFLALRVGYFGIFPEVELICWLRSVQLSGDPTTKLLAVQPTESFDQSKVQPRAFEATESSIAAAEVQALGALLIELGFPERGPRVRDTSEAGSIWWAHLTFEVGVNGKSRRLELGLGPEGIAGQDADGLRRVFRILLGMGKIQNEWSILLFQEKERPT